MAGIVKRQHLLTGLATALHFLVDGLCLCCAYLLTEPFTLPHLAEIFITYNTIAFLTQPLTGHLADRIIHRNWMLIGAAACLSLAVLLTPLFIPAHSEVPIFGIAALLGAGNSLFHAWGGKQVAVGTGNDIRALGVFVSTGAFGLAVAMVFCSWLLLYLLLTAICILATAYILADIPRHTPSTSATDGLCCRPTGFKAVLAIIAIALFVMLRSYIGTGFTAATATGDTVILAVGLAAMLGKMAGGWIALRIGLWRALTLLIAVTAVCMLSGSSALAVVLLGLFAVNCTMPVTLYLANHVLNGREGFAFGILAAALMPGYLMKS